MSSILNDPKEGSRMCPWCRETKPLDAFYRRQGKYMRRAKTCNDCSGKVAPKRKAEKLKCRKCGEQRPREQMIGVHGKLLNTCQDCRDKYRICATCGGYRLPAEFVNTVTGKVSTSCAKCRLKWKNKVKTNAHYTKTGNERPGTRVFTTDGVYYYKEIQGPDITQLNSGIYGVSWTSVDMLGIDAPIILGWGSNGRRPRAVKPSPERKKAA